jgi:hypothetical protein
MTNIVIEKGRPLILPNGTTILPHTDGPDKIINAEEVVATLQVAEAASTPFDNSEVEPLRRTIGKLPGDAKQVNPVMLILGYSMWGLDVQSIARYLSISIEQVESVQATEHYSKMRQEIIESLRHLETGSVHGFIAQNAVAAASTIMKKLSSRDEQIALRAAQDVLDRAGYRPADRTEHVHKFEDELRIRYVEDTTNPVIDVDL